MNPVELEAQYRERCVAFTNEAWPVLNEIRERFEEIHQDIQNDILPMGLGWHVFMWVLERARIDLVTLEDLNWDTSQLIRAFYLLQNAHRGNQEVAMARMNDNSHMLLLQLINQLENTLDLARRLVHQLESYAKAPW